MPKQVLCIDLSVLDDEDIIDDQRKQKNSNDIISIDDSTSVNEEIINDQNTQHNSHETIDIDDSDSISGQEDIIKDRHKQHHSIEVINIDFKDEAVEKNVMETNYKPSVDSPDKSNFSVAIGSAQGIDDGTGIYTLDDDDVEVLEHTLDYAPVMEKCSNDGAVNDEKEIKFTGIKNQQNLPHLRQDCQEILWGNDLEQNKKYCELCYCYACDAPIRECKDWEDHCTAEKEGKWKSMRKSHIKKQYKSGVRKPVQEPRRSSRIKSINEARTIAATQEQRFELSSKDAKGSNASMIVSVDRFAVTSENRNTPDQNVQKTVRKQTFTQLKGKTSSSKRKISMKADSASTQRICIAKKAQLTEGGGHGQEGSLTSIIFPAASTKERTIANKQAIKPSSRKNKGNQLEERTGSSRNNVSKKTNSASGLRDFILENARLKEAGEHGPERSKTSNIFPYRLSEDQKNAFEPSIKLVANKKPGQETDSSRNSDEKGASSASVENDPSTGFGDHFQHGSKPLNSSSVCPTTATGDKKNDKEQVVTLAASKHIASPETDSSRLSATKKAGSGCKFQNFTIQNRSSVGFGEHIQLLDRDQPTASNDVKVVDNDEVDKTKILSNKRKSKSPRRSELYDKILVLTSNKIQKTIGQREVDAMIKPTVTEPICNRLEEKDKDSKSKSTTSAKSKDAISGEAKDTATEEGEDAASCESKYDDEVAEDDDKPPMLAILLAEKTKYVSPIPCSAVLGDHLNTSNQKPSSLSVCPATVLGHRDTWPKYSANINQDSTKKVAVAPKTKMKQQEGYNDKRKKIVSIIPQVDFHYNTMAQVPPYTPLRTYHLGYPNVAYQQRPPAYPTPSFYYGNSFFP